MGQERRLALFWSLAALAPIAVASASACSSNEHEEHPEENVSRQSQALEGGATTKQLTPVADTYLKQGTPNKNQGTLTSLSIQDSGNHRTILRFDSAAMSELTDGTTTLNLAISLNANNWGTTGRQIAVYRLTTAWTELGATWNCAVDTDTSNSNDDCSGATAWVMDQPLHPELHPWVATPTAVTTITNGQSGTVTFDVSSDVALWRSGGAPNYGFIIKKVDEGAAGHVEFASRETSTPPLLTGPCTDANGDGVCDPADAGSDASSSDGGGSGGGDSGGDGASSCSPSTCVATSSCSTAACTISGCVQTPVAGGTACSDGSACTVGDVCDGLGQCSGVPVVLPPPGCVITTCDPVLGVVMAPAPDGTACPLDACTVGAACQAGTCAGGTALDCTSGNACVIDACDPARATRSTTPRPMATRTPAAAARRRISSPRSTPRTFRPASTGRWHTTTTRASRR